MKKRSIALFAALLVTSSLSFAMTLNSADKSQVTQFFINKTFTSIPASNLNGQYVENTFTGAADDQGHMWGKFAQKPADQPQTDQGTFTIKDDGQLCLTWQHWNGGQEFCVYAFNTDNAIVIVDTKSHFHTAFMKSQVQSGNKLK